MPTYEYQCSACGHQLEAFQKMSDSPLKTCPTCQKETLNKLVSAAGFQLKGTGWYKTDYVNTPKSETKSDKGADQSAKTDTGTKTDSSSSTSSGTGTP